MATESHKPSHPTLVRGGKVICMQENCISYLQPVEGGGQSSIAGSIKKYLEKPK